MKRKKCIALLLTASVFAAGLAACGDRSGEASGGGESAGTPGNGSTESAAGVDFDEEPYEATLMYWAANDARDVDAVEAAFNELTMAQLNMKVDLQPVTLGTYMQQIQMVLSSDDPLDIFPLFSSNAGTYIESGYMEDLSPYLDTYGADLKEIIGTEDISCCSIGDFLWGVPTMHERNNPVCYVVRTDLLEESGFKAEDIKTMSDLTQVYAKVKELHPDMIMYNGTNTLTQPVVQTTFDPLGGGNFGVLMNNGQDTTVTNWFESDEFRGLVDTMYEWNQKGYVSQDLATNTDTGEALMRAGNVFSFSCYGKPNTKAEKDAMTGYETTILQVTEPVCYSTATNAVAYGISANSEDPQKAVVLLNWIYKTKEANDLLNWGVEGKDYEVKEDGTIGYPEGVTAENVGYHQDFGWAQLNQYNSYVWEGNALNIYDEYQAVRDGAVVSKAYGFTFDTAPVLNEVIALTAVTDQYLTTIAAGAVDPESGIKELNDALYAAGLQKVMDEKQAQFDAWYNAQ